MVIPPHTLAFAVLSAVLSDAPASGDAPNGDDRRVRTGASDDGQATTKRELDAILRAAPKSTKIGAMRAVRLRSSVRFASAPDDPYTLDVALAFPARTRMVLQSQSGTIERYQVGDSYFARDTLRPSPTEPRPSVLIADDGEAEVALDLALRRALFLWPDEGDWVGAGTTRTTKVDDGVLMATLDTPTGRPARIVALDSSGRSAAEFRGVTWTEVEGRAWPRDLEYAANGNTIWRETVDDVQTGYRFLDYWFLPPDRMVELLGGPSQERIRLRPSRAAWIESTVWKGDDAPTSLDDAIERALELWVARSRKAVIPGEGDQEPAVYRSPIIAVLTDGNLRPQAVEFHVVADRRAATILEKRADWTRRAGSMVWIYLAGSREAVEPGALARLTTAALAGAKARGQRSVTIDRSARVRFEATAEGRVREGSFRIEMPSLESGDARHRDAHPENGPGKGQRPPKGTDG